MSLYSELNRLYGLEPYKERAREASRWWLRLPPIPSAWLARRAGCLACQLGKRLIRLGQSLEREFTVPQSQPYS